MSSSWLFPLFYANNYCLIVGEIVPDIFLLAVIDVADSTFASVVRACIRLGFICLYRICPSDLQACSQPVGNGESLFSGFDL